MGETEDEGKIAREKQCLTFDQESSDKQQNRSRQKNVYVSINILPDDSITGAFRNKQNTSQ